MRKIPTLFRRNPENRRYVLPEVTPGCEWVLAGEGVPTRKYDGTCVRFNGSRWWARREVKPGKQPPANFQAVEHDETTGKTVGWEPIEQSPFAKFHAEALEETCPHCGGPSGFAEWPLGTYELCGPKINGNPEDSPCHRLIFHDLAQRVELGDLTFEGLAKILPEMPFEGIVWHHPDGRMAKLKVRDFPRPVR